MKRKLDIKNALIKYRVTAKYIAALLGVTQGTFSKYSEKSSLENLQKIADAIGCDLFELFVPVDGDYEEPIPPTNEAHPSDLFHQSEIEEYYEDLCGRIGEVVGFHNVINSPNTEQIAGYGKCPGCGARFKIILDEELKRA